MCARSYISIAFVRFFEKNSHSQQKGMKETSSSGAHHRKKMPIISLCEQGRERGGPPTSKE